MEEGSECREFGKAHARSINVAPRSSIPSHMKNAMNIPAVSYSSSDDDDDDFFDAQVGFLFSHISTHSEFQIVN